MRPVLINRAWCSLIDVRHASDSDQIPQRNEMTRCANKRNRLFVFGAANRKAETAVPFLVVIPVSRRREERKPVFREIPLAGLEKYLGRA